MPEHALLDHLAALAGADYLSDLRCDAALARELHRALLRAPAEDFPDQMWREAVGYLLGAPPPEGDGAQACRARLLDAAAAPCPPLDNTRAK